MVTKNIEFMSCAHEYHAKHIDVVCRRLQHARSASIQIVQDLDLTRSELRQSREYDDIKRYDQIWATIIDGYSEANISEKALRSVEKILARIPKEVKKYYERLVEQDWALQKLLQDLASKKYKQIVKFFDSFEKSASSATANSIAGIAQSLVIEPIQSPSYILKRVPLT